MVKGRDIKSTMAPLLKSFIELINLKHATKNKVVNITRDFVKDTKILAITS